MTDLAVRPSVLKRFVLDYRRASRGKRSYGPERLSAPVVLERIESAAPADLVRLLRIERYLDAALAADPKANALRPRRLRVRYAIDRFVAGLDPEF